MPWVLIRENKTGVAEFEWNKATQAEMRLSPGQVQKLEIGEVVHTTMRGGTDFYLVNEGARIIRKACPMCRGKGYIETAGLKTDTDGEVYG